MSMKDVVIFVKSLYIILFLQLTVFKLNNSLSETIFLIFVQFKEVMNLWAVILNLFSQDIFTEQLYF